MKDKRIASLGREISLFSSKPSLRAWRMKIMLVTSIIIGAIIMCSCIAPLASAEEAVSAENVVNMSDQPLVRSPEPHSPVTSPASAFTRSRMSMMDHASSFASNNNRAIPDVTPGFQASISNKALELALRSVMPIVYDGLHMTIIPEWSSPDPPPNGQTYLLTDLTVRSIQAHEANLAFTTKDQGGLMTELKNVSLVVSFKWKTPKDSSVHPAVAYLHGSNTGLNRNSDSGRSRYVVRRSPNEEAFVPDIPVPIRRHNARSHPYRQRGSAVAYVQGEGPVSLLPNRVGNDDAENNDNAENNEASREASRAEPHTRARSYRQSGTATAIFSNCILKSLINMKTQGDDLHLKPAFEVLSTSFEIADSGNHKPEIRVDGGEGAAPDWFASTISNDFAQRSPEALSQAFQRRCKKATDCINREISQRLKTRRVCPVLGELDVAFVRIPAPIRYYDQVGAKEQGASGIAIAINGEMYTKENAGKPNPSDGVVPRDADELAKAFQPTGRMFDACLSLFSLNSIIHAICRAGGIHVILNRQTVPKELNFPWNTNQWIPIIPQLAMVFPSAEVEIEIVSASPQETRIDEPRFHITDAKMLDRLLSTRRINVVDSTQGSRDKFEDLSPDNVNVWRSSLVSERTSFSPFMREVRRQNPLSPAVSMPAPLASSHVIPQLPSFSTPRHLNKQGALALDGPLLIKIVVRPSIGPEKGKRVEALVLRADITSAMSIDVKNHHNGPSVLAVREPFFTPTPSAANPASISSEYATTVNNRLKPVPADAAFERAINCRARSRFGSESPLGPEPVVPERASIPAEPSSHVSMGRNGNDGRRGRVPPPSRRPNVIPREELIRRARRRLPFLPHLAAHNGTRRPGYYRSSVVRLTIPRAGTSRAASAPFVHVSSRLNLTRRRIRRIGDRLFENDDDAYSPSASVSASPSNGLADGPAIIATPAVRNVITYSSVAVASAPTPVPGPVPVPVAVAPSTSSNRFRMRRRVANLQRNTRSTTSLSRSRNGMDGHISRDNAINLRCDVLTAAEAQAQGGVGGILGSRALLGSGRSSVRSNLVLPDGSRLRTSASRSAGSVRRLSAIHDRLGRLTVTQDDNLSTIDDYEMDFDRDILTPANPLRMPIRSASNIHNNANIINNGPHRPSIIPDSLPMSAVVIGRKPQVKPAPQPHHNNHHNVVNPTLTPVHTVVTPVAEPLEPTVTATAAVVPEETVIPSPSVSDRSARNIRRVTRRLPTQPRRRATSRDHYHIRRLPLGLPSPSVHAEPDEPRRRPTARKPLKQSEDYTRIYPRITKAGLTFSVVESRIGKFDPNRLNRLAGAFLDLVLIPTLNQRLERGIPLYCPAGYLVENAVVEFKNNAINVSADVSYKPPHSILRELRHAFRVARSGDLVRQAIRRARAERTRRGGPRVGC